VCVSPDSGVYLTIIGGGESENCAVKIARAICPLDALYPQFIEARVDLRRDYRDERTRIDKSRSLPECDRSTAGHKHTLPFEVEEDAVEASVCHGRVVINCWSK
jgi:hypothetical protein